MSCAKQLVVTVYGHDKTIDKFAVNFFDISERSTGNVSDAGTYCDTINGLTLEGNHWVFAKTVSRNTSYVMDTFLPVEFDIILLLDDRSIQKVLRELDSQDIAIALKGEEEALKQKIFNNMSARAVKILKKDMEYIGTRISDVREKQEAIIKVIRILEERGEIVVSHKGETVE